MIGVVLAAGPGSRLGELTAEIPKTLLPVAGERTILDLTLANLRSVGIEDVVVVTGFAHERVAERVPALQERHGVRLQLRFNDRALEWNNAYSLWLVRDRFADGVLLVNGDTVHPAGVERTLLDAPPADLLLAVDHEKALGVEEMKVLLDAHRRVTRIDKAIEPARAEGEYIGLTLIAPAAAQPLADALEATWRRDTTLYYEDGFQELVDRGGDVHTAAIGRVDWVEVDDERDLERAREIACRS
ncbi:MAG TPA: phosphocholine cytidylyltransferase family protein [Solirubrobacteraceae bacterium]|nr:phosphocholine cytidylyltransferase family protein [Solirubrobacteraceae bacterium]